MEWKECGPRRLTAIPEFENRGWIIEFDERDIIAQKITPDDPPMYSIKFKKNDKIVWSFIDKWYLANIIDDEYDNIHKYTNIEDIFKITT